MILLVLGVVCFVAALRVAGNGREGAGELVRGAGAAAWAALVALLILLQLAVGARRDRMEGYRLTLLGFRYQVAEQAGAPATALSVGGSYESADLWVPGAGDRPVALLRPAATGNTVEVHAELDAGAVAMVEERGLLGSSWTVLGGRSVGPGDTVVVQGPDSTYRLVVESVPDTVHLLGIQVAVPWVREHVLRVVGATGTPSPGRALLPGVERGPLTSLRPWHPSVLQRTYPLADVLTVTGAEGSLPALSSFFYYQDGALHLADLDSEVQVLPAASAGDTSDPALPDAMLTGGRLLVAGLPHRDYPEPDLTLPERYGVRPLRSFRVERHGAWIDAGLSSPEIRGLDRQALEELRLPDSRGEDGSAVYRIRLAPARDALARQAVVFAASPERFAVPGQAILTLPVDPAVGDIEVLTPSGQASWHTGRPLALGTGERSLLVRVDGQGTSAGYWLVHGALLLLPVLLFLLRPMTGPVFALALTALALAGFRLVLALSALSAPPYAMEAQQLGLWLLPFLPWAVVVAGELGARWRTTASAPRLAPASWRRQGFHALYALVLVGLAAVLFPTSSTKAGALGIVALGTAAIRMWADQGWPRVRAAWRRFAARITARPWLLQGWSLGLGLLALRALLDAAGWREQLTVGGTRIGVSLLYTPLAAVALAVVLFRWDGVLRRARGAGGFPRQVARALLDVGVFLLLAYVGVGAWISDFGLALVLLPGALVLLALAGARWAPEGRAGALTMATLGLPLMLFVLLQVAPPLLRFSWGGDLQAVDARLGEWNRNELLLLERGDPEGLRLIGQRRSEALAVMRETMRSYTRGNLLGKGFLEGRVSDEIAETSTREHVASALLASQFGLPGTAGLIMVLLALLPPALGLLGEDGRRNEGAAGGTLSQPGHEGGGPAVGVGVLTLLLVVLVPTSYLLPSPFNVMLVGVVLVALLVALVAPAFGGAGVWGWADGGTLEAPHRPAALPARRLIATSALLTMALAGLYMVLANYGLAFFTGKNVYLLGLDSVGDALEAVALLALAAVALGLESSAPTSHETAAPESPETALQTTHAEWWHASDRDRE